jgi:hypothetical protein
VSSRKKPLKKMAERLAGTTRAPAAAVKNIKSAVEDKE